MIRVMTIALNDTVATRDFPAADDFSFHEDILYLQRGTDIVAAIPRGRVLSVEKTPCCCQDA